MSALATQVPAPLLGGAAVVVILTAFLTIVLGWHAARRIWDVPRVPRPAALYVVLGALWLGFGLGCAAIAFGIVLLRDHALADGRTPLAEVRCAKLSPARVRVELVAPNTAAVERYELDGDACSLQVRKLGLRAPWRILGLDPLLRIERVGHESRPLANPAWLTPREPGGAGLVNVLVQESRAVPIVIPPDQPGRQRLVSTADGEPKLETTPI
jgi:hypothetical protein